MAKSRGEPRENILFLRSKAEQSVESVLKLRDQLGDLIGSESQERIFVDEDAETLVEEVYNAIRKYKAAKREIRR